MEGNMKMFIGANLLCIFYLIKGSVAVATLEVLPSIPFYENQQVQVTCLFESNAAGALFKFPRTTPCTVYQTGAECLSGCSTFPSCDTTSYTVHATARKTWNNQSAFCDSIHGGSQSQPVLFYVNVPVTHVKFSPSPITVNTTEHINLTCRSSFSNPASTIVWFKDSSPVTDSGIKTFYESNEYDLKSTKSVWTYEGAKEDNLQMIHCQASNLNVTVASTGHLLDVKYPPTDPVSIFVEPRGLQYMTGANISLLCKQPDGNPVSSLSWNCKGLDMPGYNLSSSAEAISVLNITVDETFNKEECSCIANHILFTEMKIEKVMLIVFVPVKVVTITASQSSVNISEEMDFACETDFCNPSANITWYIGDEEMKYGVSDISTGGNYNLKKTKSTFQYRGMEKDNGKSVSCKAYNLPGTLVESSSFPLNVIYPPSGTPLISSNSTSFEIIDGDVINVTCIISGGNPLATLIWDCISSPSKLETHNHLKMAISTFIFKANKYMNNKDCTCTAIHPLETKSTSVKITVFYKSNITSTFKEVNEYNENERIHIVCNVDGNPSSNITWKFLKTNAIVNTSYMSNYSILDISSANCKDHGKYGVFAENIIGSVNSTTTVAVKCKPRMYNEDVQTSDKYGIGNNDSLNITLRILLYPTTNTFEWMLSRNVNESVMIKNNTNGYKVTNSVADNEQNITLFKKYVSNEEFGNYTITVSNSEGEFMKNYQVNAARAPLLPSNVTLVCNSPFSIKLSWISDFNGGGRQLFHVFYSSAVNASWFKELDILDDRGYGHLHNYSPVEGLYGQMWFKITASNQFGNSTTDAIGCITIHLTENTDSLPVSVIAGGATAGGLALATVIIVAIILMRKIVKIDKQAGKAQRFENVSNDNENIDDDGIKDNPTYISAGPRDDGAPEAAVYASVNKKGPEGNNNANIYAEVKKTGDKKGGGGGKILKNIKPKKGKKQKNKQEVGDVYENSEDIAMTTQADNVYSNTVRGNQPPKKDQRGYKNKDGLLYVEVQFDAQPKTGNPVIHGEDEKTDYATVEFPMPPTAPDGEN